MHWTRVPTAPSIDCETARARTVFAVPGTSSKRTCPLQASARARAGSRRSCRGRRSRCSREAVSLSCDCVVELSASGRPGQHADGCSWGFAGRRRAQLRLPSIAGHRARRAAGDRPPDDLQLAGSERLDAERAKRIVGDATPRPRSEPFGTCSARRPRKPRPSNATPRGTISAAAAEARCLPRQRATRRARTAADRSRGWQATRAGRPQRQRDDPAALQLEHTSTRRTRRARSITPRCSIFGRARRRARSEVNAPDGVTWRGAPAAHDRCRRATNPWLVGGSTVRTTPDTRIDTIADQRSSPSRSRERAIVVTSAS